VKLEDINDNPPFILPMSTVTIPDGDGKRTILKVKQFIPLPPVILIEVSSKRLR